MLLLCDASALLSLPECARTDASGFWEAMTEAIESGSLGFPRAVVYDVAELGRSTEVLGWAQGLGSSLTPFAPNIKHQRWLMAQLQLSFGMDAGFETLYDRDPSVKDVMLVARDLSNKAKNFAIVTEDFGRGPLNPTTEQLCAAFGWSIMSTADAIRELCLSQFLRKQE
jgi:hypothetical protein